MKKVFINGLKVILIKLAMCFITVCLLFAFTWLFRLPGGFTFYSVFMTIFMGVWIYSTANEFGRKLYSRQKPHLYGFLTGFVGEIPSVLMLLFMPLMKGAFRWINIAFCLYNSTYAGFFKPDGKIFHMTSTVPLYYGSLIVVPVIYFVGYFLGQKGIEANGSVLYRLVYKKGGDENGK